MTLFNPTERFRTGPIALSIVAFVVMLLLAPATSAQTEQSNADLRRENDQLKNRIARLEAQLAQAEAMIDRLEKQLAEARGETGEGGAEGEGEAEERGANPVPSDPMACPASLFNALEKSFNSEFADVSDTESRSFLRRVAAWAKRAEREYRGDVEWLIDVKSVEEESTRFHRVTYQVIDPISGEPIGEGSTTTMPSRYAEEFTENPDVQRWRVEGFFFASPEIDPDRPNVDSVGERPMIGPYAIFDYQLTVRDLEPASD